MGRHISLATRHRIRTWQRRHGLAVLLLLLACAKSRVAPSVVEESGQDNLLESEPVTTTPEEPEPESPPREPSVLACEEILSEAETMRRQFFLNENVASCNTVEDCTLGSGSVGCFDSCNCGTPLSRDVLGEFQTSEVEVDAFCRENFDARMEAFPDEACTFSECDCIPSGPLRCFQNRCVTLPEGLGPIAKCADIDTAAENYQDSFLQRENAFVCEDDEDCTIVQGNHGCALGCQCGLAIRADYVYAYETLAASALAYCEEEKQRFQAESPISICFQSSCDCITSLPPARCIDRRCTL